MPDGRRVTEGSAPFAAVLLDVPIAPVFDYRIPSELQADLAPGDWVVVPWANRQRVGVVAARSSRPGVEEARVRELIMRLDDAPRLDAAWLAHGRFAADYYHCHPGELLVPAMPKRLRRVPPAPGSTRRPPVDVFADARRRFGRHLARQATGPGPGPSPPLTGEQLSVLENLRAGEGYRCTLLHGITGSGKTEVYLNWLAGVLAADPVGQVLLLVPEIALTPQLADRVRERLRQPCAILHSAMTEPERAAHWLAAAEGRARVVIGTRLAVLAPLPGLAAVVVDEEHDPSFKQQEHPHYSARDLAVARAHAAGIPVVLGSATPSLETWHAARRGRYRLASMTRRATGAAMPEIRIVPLREPRPGDSDSPPPEGLTAEAFGEIRATVDAGRQCLLFLNRRGFAPVLSCGHCGWLSQCEHCSAYRVLHRRARGQSRRSFGLVCHHCGAGTPVPERCPDCGDPGLVALGRGTQRVEELLAEALPDARIARLDRDVARRAGATQAIFERLHAGEIDIIIGTQMLAKGHDVQRLSLVVVLDPDGALFSSDFRGPERLYAMLTQVAGRAGRHDGVGRVIVQTRFSDHPVFAALMAHDYDAFADSLLTERREAGLPPFSHHAMLRAQAAEMGQAQGFLAEAQRQAREIAASGPAGPIVYDPVPMPLSRVAGISRAQLLVESPTRPALHALLRAWRAWLESRPGRVRWQIEVDPIEI